jgi:N-acetylmuramoyl-L-alanine amidase
MYWINARISILIVLVLIFAFKTNDFWSQKSVQTIVIDAGHGGKDPGCHGKHSKEKHVCLSMAIKLGNLIKNKYPELKVIYTRETDVFVELAERANIANKAKADLFICIHANAASPAAYGTETYVLGLHRTEAQQKVASRENSIIELENDGGAQYEKFNLSPDAIIAKRLQLSVFLDHAILFAQFLQREFKKLGRRDRGVKQAGFVVLYRTTMPSVLIETGFLTNINEENFIGKDEGQNKMANAMFQAFVDYKNKIEGTDSDINSTLSTHEQVDSPTIVKEEVKTGKSSFSDQVEQEIIKDKGLVFRVQIISSTKNISAGSSRFKNQKDIYKYYQGGLYKYCAGHFSNDLQSAKSHRSKMRELDFNGAFVVAFLDGERISIEKAIKLVEN